MKKGPPIRIPPRRLDTHKGDCGHAVLVGGSRGMTGSITMASIAALKTGAGLVSTIVPDRCLEAVATADPCLMTIPVEDDSRGRFGEPAAETIRAHVATLIKSRERRIAVGCGPGMSTHAASRRIIAEVMRTALPRVIDADGLNCLASFGDDTAPWRIDVANPVILTPHAGELERLTGAPKTHRAEQLAAASAFCRRTRAVMVVKGGPTRVVDDDGRTWTNPTGNPGMATGGSGDVLTGILTALLGQQFSAWHAARLGVWIHGYAGDQAARRLGQTSMTANDILDELFAATIAASHSPVGSTKAERSSCP